MRSSRSATGTSVTFRRSGVTEYTMPNSLNTYRSVYVLRVSFPVTSIYREFTGVGNPVLVPILT